MTWICMNIKILSRAFSVQNRSEKSAGKFYFSKSKIEVVLMFFFTLELIHHINDSIKSKIVPILKLPRFFTTYTVYGKIAKLELFLSEWSRSYIVFALAKKNTTSDYGQKVNGYPCASIIDHRWR